MSKISLVSRRKDKYFDSPTQASQRAQKRLAEEENSTKPPADAKDINILMEEGSPTVELNVPPDQNLDFEALTSEYLKGKDKAKIMTVIEKEKIGNKWGLKLQFLPEQPSKLLSSIQLAQMFGVSPHTISRLVKQGIIKGYKIGKHWRFNWSEILESLAKKQGGS
ncbi:MAG: helix-turn-helix domain-containing protein [Kiritimatiellae bacterium]|nr:helix-turn-helix domain-containing protein [Kiritimatiellia bacterium]MDD5519987.1 helix-turn-helix domain-containing protein [Kiritimatiellia bacterium]